MKTKTQSEAWFRGLEGGLVMEGHLKICWVRAYLISQLIESGLPRCEDKYSVHDNPLNRNATRSKVFNDDGSRNEWSTRQWGSHNAPFTILLLLLRTTTATASCSTHAAKAVARTKITSTSEQHICWGLHHFHGSIRAPDIGPGNAATPHIFTGRRYCSCVPTIHQP